MAKECRKRCGWTRRVIPARSAGAPEELEDAARSQRCVLADTSTSQMYDYA